MEFVLDDLQNNLIYFSETFGRDFITKIAICLDNFHNISSLENEINKLFIAEGTNYFMASADASGNLLSSPTGTDQIKKSENSPVQNEIKKVERKIDEIKRKLKSDTELSL